uniref:ATP synthase subunit a n=1 Tax=Aulorhynchus flavidus TaxID=240152 RepID=A7E1L0_9TELE|nr:ATP synthase F0 subunit 6 [Aulorhynchus flavidus]BAF74904.1 ATPase subunit 6 [Aulorhynchus flavidus]
MTLSFFDQFMSPVFMGIPLILLALSLPWILLPNPTLRWLSNRFLALQNSAIGNATQQLFSPINPNGHNWAILLIPLLLFLITLNMLGILPYTFTPTTQLSINLAIATPLWLATVILGMRKQPTIALSHILPMGTPNLLIPILIIIETISLFVRPVALAVRMTANLTAGHLLMQLIATAGFVLMSNMPVIALNICIVLFLLSLLEMAVAMIQAYVFVLLLTLYLQENV